MLCKGDQLILPARWEKCGSPWPFSQAPAEQGAGRMSCSAGSSRHLSRWPPLLLHNGTYLVDWPGGPGEGGLPDGSLLPPRILITLLPPQVWGAWGKDGVQNRAAWSPSVSGACFLPPVFTGTSDPARAWAVHLCSAKVQWARRFWEVQHTPHAHAICMGSGCVMQWGRRISLLFPDTEKMLGVCLVRTVRHHTIECKIGLGHKEHKRLKNL